MIDLFQKVLEGYTSSLTENFASHPMADFLRTSFSLEIKRIIKEKDRYIVKGSSGQGQWTYLPWVAILDLMVTDTAQSGFYPVFLFKEDLSGFYFSLNQGVTDIKEKYKKDALFILRLKAQDYRAQLQDLQKKFSESEIYLKGTLNYKSKDAKYYEAGNIVAKYYSKDRLPTDAEIVNDIHEMLTGYRMLVFNETMPVSQADVEDDEEKYKGTEYLKKFRFHKKLERNASLIKKVKQFRGFICEVCDLNFEERYGEIGKGFIEAHHLTPLSILDGDKIQLDARTDFKVLCPNCHRMIHKLDDVSDIELLRSYILRNPMAKP